MCQERWCRVEPGVVLDELNAHLRPHGLRFAPDVSTASRATIGGMMANNSSGARSVMYGKTIDHVIEQDVVLSDGSVVTFGPLAEGELDSKCSGDTLEARCYRTVVELASSTPGRNRAPVPESPPARWRVQPRRLPTRAALQPRSDDGRIGRHARGRAVGEAEPRSAAEGQGRHGHPVRAPARIAGRHTGHPRHGPSAVEVMDKSILDHTRKSAALEAMRQSFIEGDPGVAALRRVLRRSRRGPAATPRGTRSAICGRSASAIAITTLSTWPHRRESGVFARPVSGSRWRCGRTQSPSRSSKTRRSPGAAA